MIEGISLVDNISIIDSITNKVFSSVLLKPTNSALVFKILTISSYFSSFINVINLLFKWFSLSITSFNNALNDSYLIE